MEEIFVPVALFATIPLTVWAVMHYRNRSNEARARLLSTMVERGEPVTPAIIRALGVRARPRHAELRTGLVLVAIALATFMFGGAIPDPEGRDAVGALGMFPLLIGLVYVGLWTFITRKDQARLDAAASAEADLLRAEAV